MYTRLQVALQMYLHKCDGIHPDTDEDDDGDGDDNISTPVILMIIFDYINIHDFNHNGTSRIQSHHYYY